MKIKKGAFMGLSLSSNQIENRIRFSYSGFNRIRYLILSYVQDEQYETVSNNQYLYHFLSAYSDHDYTFKNIIEHSDCEGVWTYDEIITLIKEFDENQFKIIDHAKNQNNFMEGMDDISLDNLIQFLKLHKDKKSSLISFT